MFHVKHFCPIAGIFLTSLALGLAAAFVLFSPRSGAFDLETVNQGSHIVVDRNGVLLRAFTTPDGRWRLPVQASETDPRYLAMIAYEDQRFYSHYGVDFLSLGRAALQWAGHGHIVSGGSTLTMQAARLLAPRAEKSVVAKLEQILRALGIERRTSKTGVLDLYLALAPYGGNIEGVRAASLAYFGHEVKRLFSQEHAGSIDMTLAIRSPGSTLKPFIYALAFDAGIANPLKHCSTTGRDIMGAMRRKISIFRFRGW
jgi:penicillin-binding protein 1C